MLYKVWHDPASLSTNIYLKDLALAVSSAWNRLPQTSASFAPSLFVNVFLLILESGGEREIETCMKDKHWLVSCCTSSPSPTGDWAGNLGICPDWESDWQLPDARVDDQPSGPHHQLGAPSFFRSFLAKLFKLHTVFTTATLYPTFLFFSGVFISVWHILYLTYIPF